MFAAEHVHYESTRAFSSIVNDYLNGSSLLRPFYQEQVSMEGIRNTIDARKKKPINRQLLVEVLEKQYSNIESSEKVSSNIRALLQDNCFTVCTAHQPNLFTGPLYFMYKIIHAIRLADQLNANIPDCRFVPVYYMGSEDADFAELNHTYVDGKKIEWKKEQKGAVGRMTVDATLLQLINELEGQLTVEEKGVEVIQLLRKCYTLGQTIQEATFELVHELYGRYGLVVLIPDSAALKALMKPVFCDDIFNNKPLEIVQKTSERLEEHYTAQAFPRPINLFYLKGDIRERIVEEDGQYKVHHTEISFSKEELEKELEVHPENFSPNVILRGLYQETILPNIAFVGGGGELAYWLQLKDLFHHYDTSFPVLVVRNSYLVVEKKWKEKMDRLQLSTTDLFETEAHLMHAVVNRYSGKIVHLNGNLEKAESLFSEIGTQAELIDPTLAKHVAAIRKRSMDHLLELEKKMYRAEKRKYAEQERGIRKVKEALFPGGGLQERKENFSRFYAKWGSDFIEALYHHALTTEQEFTVLFASE